VRTLAEGVYPAGNNNVGWDGTNESGINVSFRDLFVQDSHK